MENLEDFTIPKKFQITVELFELRQVTLEEKSNPTPNPFVII